MPPAPRRTAAVLAVLGLAAAGCSGSASGSGAATGVIPPADRKAAPLVSHRTLDGTSLALASLRGHTVVVNVWGSWCGPCQAEQPDLVRVAAATAALGVAFVGDDVQDTTAQAQAHRREYGVGYPSWDDSGSAVAAQFRGLPVKSVPSTLVVDAQGRVAARFIGPTTADALQPVVEQIARGA